MDCDRLAQFAEHGAEWAWRAVPARALSLPGGRLPGPGGTLEGRHLRVAAPGFYRVARLLGPAAFAV